MKRPEHKPPKKGNIYTFPTQLTNPISQTIGRYTLLKWNGHYGEFAKFIVRDNLNGLQSMFIPGRCQDLLWLNTDLANDSMILCWDEFDDESFDDLEEIAF